MSINIKRLSFLDATILPRKFKVDVTKGITQVVKHVVNILNREERWENENKWYRIGKSKYSHA